MFEKLTKYFITICTVDKKHMFGEIVEDRIQLSEIGKLAYNKNDKETNMAKILL